MSYHLSSCVWEITLACSFSCKHCGSKGGRARPDELTTEECLEVVRQLAVLNCQRVNLIGGEVFMRKDYLDIIRALRKHGIRVTIITNGYLFDEKLITNLKDLGIESIAVSLDGTQDVHDGLRQVGSYERALRAIRQLTDHEIPVSVITTLNSMNVTTLENLYAVLENYPIMAWQLQGCNPMGNVHTSAIDYRIDFQEVIAFVRKHLYEAPFALGIADNIGYYMPDEGTLRGNRYGKRHFTGCRAGLTSVGIDSVGNIRGCEAMYDDAFIEGNIRERSLIDIWQDPEAFAYNRQFDFSLLTGYCAKCSYGSYCAGGCRSFNYFSHKKLYESPYCVYKELIISAKDLK